MSDNIREPANAAAAIDFLDKLQGSRPRILFVLPNDKGGFESLRFNHGKKADAERKLKIWDRADRDVYFLLANNDGGKRRKKENITGADLVWADVDPEDIDWKDETVLTAWQARTLSRLNQPATDVPGPPTVIWSSGRGFWAVWALDRTCTDTKQLEDVCRALAAAYGGDKAHDCSRVARLAGTRNSKTGRVARLLSHNPERVYSIDVFPREEKPELGEAVEITAKVGGPVTDLFALALPGWLLSLIQHGVDAPDVDPNVRETKKPKDRSAQLWRAIRGMIRCGLGDSIILAIVLDKRYGISAHLLASKSDPVKAAKRTLSKARQSVEGSVSVAGSDEYMGDSDAASDGDNAIFVTKHVDQFTTDLARAVRRFMPDMIFRRGGELVRLRTLERDERHDDGSIKRAGSVEIAAVDVPWLRLACDRAGLKYFKLDGEGNPRHIAPPHQELREWIAVGDELPIDELRGISRTPTLTRSEPGFDLTSGLYLQFVPSDFPPIPECPTHEQALEAAHRLWGYMSPFRAFPFTSNEAGAVLASMLLSGVIRGELATCPMHIVDAPTPGTGKDLMVECVGAIISGVPPQRITWSGDENEPEKRLSSLLLAGAQCIQIGNVTRPIGGPFICDVLTSTVQNVRILGESRTPRVSTRALMMVSGNNVKVRGDMTRRVLFCRLDARVPQPETRRFDFDAMKEAVDRRGELVAAALTVLRAYEAAGRPRDASSTPPLGSFGDWDLLVRGALLWLGLSDPVATQESGREDDEDLERDVGVLTVLAATFGEGEFKTADLEDPVCPKALAARNEITSWIRGDRWDRRQAGRLIGGLKDRPRGGMVLRSRKGGGNLKYWRVERL
jgi:hypothetical protein